LAPPSLIDVPPGCAFHPRCPYAQERCKREIPELREVAPAHLAACHFAGQPGFGQGAAGNGEGVA